MELSTCGIMLGAKRKLQLLELCRFRFSRLGMLDMYYRWSPIRAELIKLKSQHCPLLFALLSLRRSSQHLSRLSTVRCLLMTSFHLDQCSRSQPHHTNCRRQDSSLSSDASKGTSKAWGYGYLCAHHFLKCMHYTRWS